MYSQSRRDYQEMREEIVKQLTAWLKHYGFNEASKYSLATVIAVSSMQLTDSWSKIRIKWKCLTSE